MIAWLEGVTTGPFQWASPRQKAPGPHRHLRYRIIGAIGGGWAATKLFHVHTLHRFFNLSTWVTAVIGAVVLLLIFHLFSRRG